MQYIPTNTKVSLEWTVKRGIGSETENFSRSAVTLFLVSDANRWPVPCEAGYEGTVKAELPESLPEGVYSLELVWVKNDGSINATRCIQRTRKTCVFAIGAGASVADARAVRPDIPGIPDTPPVLIPIPTATVKLTTAASSYGYDGLSAYEICAMRGKTSLSEEEWAEKLQKVINSVE
jgi:hypothetical protein